MDINYVIRELIKIESATNLAFKRVRLDDDSFIRFICQKTGMNREEYFGIMEFKEYAVEIFNADGKFMRQLEVFTNRAEAKEYIDKFDDEELDYGEYFSITTIMYNADGEEVIRN